jgi:predicted patatin/cPLA2 family phospholipase
VLIGDAGPVNTSMGVADLLQQRKASGSRPGQRSDPHRLVLAIEGGGSRATYPSGVAIALDELGLLPAFDGVYGVSAGAVTGAWFVSGKSGCGLFQWPRLTRNVLSLRHLPAGRPLIDTAAVLSASETYAPGILERMYESEVPLHPIATCTSNGRACDLRAHIHDAETLGRAIMASATIPFPSGRPVELGGRCWVDGGLAENVPLRTAVAGGATRIVVLRCRIEGETLRPPSWSEHAAVGSYLVRHSRPALGAWLRRYQSGIEDDDLLVRQSAHDVVDGPRVLEIRAPRTAYRVTRLERDQQILRRAIYVGRAAGYGAIAGAGNDVRPLPLEA